MRQDITNHHLAELTNDCRLLVISHMPLAYAMAWKLRDRGISLDDLRQEGCLGLCEAALRYNESIDCTFATYARHWCRKMMFAAIRRQKATGNQPAEDCQKLENDEILRIGQQHRIDEALQCLTARERQIVEYYYGINTDRLSIAEIATEIGISKPRASELHVHALKKLEAALAKRPLYEYLTPWLE